MKAMNFLFVLVAAIGAINWGLVGIMKFNAVSWLFETTLQFPALVDITYIVVGVCGVLAFIFLFLPKK